MSRYEDGEYLSRNPTWDVERSPWKAREIIKLIDGHNIEPRTLCEVGCGAGEILVQLSKMLPEECTFVGYDISPQLRDFWRARETDRIRFVRQDFLTSEETYDVLIFADLIEHIEDYIGFLRKIRDRGRYKIFKFPLEIYATSAILGHKYAESRARYGHLHYFNKDICLCLLKELDYRVIAHNHVAAPIDLSLSKAAVLPRFLLSRLSIGLTARLLGGYSLLVLAE